MSGLLDWVPWPKEGVSDFAQSPGRATCVTSPRLAGRPAHTRTQPPFHFCPGVYYARLVEELRPLTYGLFGHKTKLMPKDRWPTILGHSPDAADALIQSMLLAA